MTLRISNDRPFLHIGLIRRIVEDAPGGEVVELNFGNGAAQLLWLNARDLNHSIRLAIPIGWLNAENKSRDIEAATNNVVAAVLSSNGR